MWHLTNNILLHTVRSLYVLLTDGWLHCFSCWTCGKKLWCWPSGRDHHPKRFVREWGWCQQSTLTKLKRPLPMHTHTHTHNTTDYHLSFLTGICWCVYSLTSCFFFFLFCRMSMLCGTGLRIADGARTPARTPSRSSKLTRIMKITSGEWVGTW